MCVCVCVCGREGGREGVELSLSSMQLLSTIDHYMVQGKSGG